MPPKNSTTPKIQVPLHIRRRAVQLNPDGSRSALLLPTEDAGKLHSLLSEFHEYFRPASVVETSLIAQMVFAVWRFHRNAGYETIALTVKAEELLEEHKKTYGVVDYDRLLAQAAESVSGFSTLLNRTFTTCRNTFRGALADLEKVRKLKGDPDQPYLHPSKDFDFCTNFAQSAAPPPARIFEMPIPVATPMTEPQPAPEAVQHVQPAEPEPVRPRAQPPSTAQPPSVDKAEWFECKDYQPPELAVVEDTPQEPSEQPKPPICDINGNPVVIHKQVKPKFNPARVQWTATPETGELIRGALEFLKRK